MRAICHEVGSLPTLDGRLFAATTRCFAPFVEFGHSA